jgi:Ribosomal protein L13e
LYFATLQEAGISKKVALSIGIAVDHRRTTRSVSISALILLDVHVLAAPIQVIRGCCVSVIRHCAYIAGAVFSRA